MKTIKWYVANTISTSVNQGLTDGPANESISNWETVIQDANAVKENNTIVGYNYTKNDVLYQAILAPAEMVGTSDCSLAVDPFLENDETITAATIANATDMHMTITKFQYDALTYTDETSSYITITWTTTGNPNRTEVTSNHYVNNTDNPITYEGGGYFKMPFTAEAYGYKWTGTLKGFSPVGNPYSSSSTPVSSWRTEALSTSSMTLSKTST